MATGRDRNEPDYLPPTPAEGLEQMAVTPDVITIAQKMKPDSLKKFPGCTTYTPLYYIKNRGGTKYCFRVRLSIHTHAACLATHYSCRASI